ncbi:MAG TPA: hypothetical protein VHF58_03190 [Solirubrobacterales bacterium]|nr:hypothetical protein [Solirubrobacterales bacterium]
MASSGIAPPIITKVAAILAGGAIVALIGAAPGSAGQLAPTLDQQQTQSSADLAYEFGAGGTAPGGKYDVAQTFTAGLTGPMSQIDLQLSNYNTPCAVTVEIHSVLENGTPSGEVLASKNLSAADLPDSGDAFVSVIFPQPASVVAGTKYAVVLYSPETPCARVRAASNTSYSGGHVLVRNFFVVWNHQVIDDLAFRTYVLTSDGGPGGGGGGGGGDQASCSGQVAKIVGTDRAETLVGTSKADVIAGLGGNDTIRGLGGNDRICGDEGKDKLKGGGGKDRLNGGASSDALNGGGGDDKCVGGPGGDDATKCEVERST